MKQGASSTKVKMNLLFLLFFCCCCFFLLHDFRNKTTKIIVTKITRSANIFTKKLYARINIFQQRTYASLVILWSFSNTHAVRHLWPCNKLFWVESVTEFICYVYILFIDSKWWIIDWNVVGKVLWSFFYSHTVRHLWPCDKSL